MHTAISIYMYIYTYANAYLIYIYAYIYMPIHIHRRIYFYIGIYIGVHMYKHIYIYILHAYISLTTDRLSDGSEMARQPTVTRTVSLSRQVGQPIGRLFVHVQSLNVYKSISLSCLIKLYF